MDPLCFNLPLVAINTQEYHMQVIFGDINIPINQHKRVSWTITKPEGEENFHV